MDQLRSGSVSVNVNVNKTIKPPSFFISCDWGTSRFRIALVQSNPLKPVCSLSDSDGIKKIYNRWEASKNSNQEDFYVQILSDKVAQLREKAGSNHDIDALPVIISGMASSELGLKHLPYQLLPIPASANNLITHHKPAYPQFEHDIYLVSGLKTDDDIMRGEETLLLGVIAQHHIENGTVILPGTHSKHIHIADGTIKEFTTFMTGELFELLSTQSILSKTVEMPTNWNDQEGFKEGLNDSKRDGFMSQLFKIRSTSLLHDKKGAYNYFRLSGQLIGSEIKWLVQHSTNNIYVAGTYKLLLLYKLACKSYNCSCQIVKQSKDLLAAGHLQIIINNTK